MSVLNSTHCVAQKSDIRQFIRYTVNDTILEKYNQKLDAG